ncbi:permease-like cell division protein FtsX [Ureibacillus manganicus]|uniref:Cell division protein FtsX n=1 Tax=Ureibacillus manganicus DSM 26584 TaxID=1384049 RepID=A0A0A3J0K3_9BACL|nr:permease-like cell division protein FtsX [Ureibacillus manganicus]KGR80587.1 cell division protein FtsX [Ureibacillus manganicus DSM 26584]
MKARTIRRHFRESLKSLSRNGWMSFASISAVTVTLLLVGVFAIIMLNLNNTASSVEEDVEVKVLINIIEDEQQLKAAEDKLIQQVKSISGVAEARYSSKDEELNLLIEKLGEEFKLYEQSNPLRSAIYVKAEDPLEILTISEKIRKLENVHSVVDGKDTVENLFGFLETARNIGLVLILGLLFTVIFLISNTIRITIIARKDEIEIMKLVGATNSFVRIPFLLEGIWIGILGSIIPMIAVSVAYHNIYDALAPRLKGQLLQLLEVSPLIWQVNGLMIILGIFIGLWGSFMSVRKFLKA